jgi:hypothetical protein
MIAGADKINRPRKQVEIKAVRNQAWADQVAVTLTAVQIKLETVAIANGYSCPVKLLH